MALTLTISLFGQEIHVDVLSKRKLCRKKKKKNSLA